MAVTNTVCAVLPAACFVAFSVMGPIGVCLGMAVKQVAPPIVDALMLATVAGTFIYVGATEVIPEEWEDQEHKWVKFGALLFGITSIFIITQYTAGLEGAAGRRGAEPCGRAAPALVDP